MSRPYDPNDPNDRHYEAVDAIKIHESRVIDDQILLDRLKADTAYQLASNQHDALAAAERDASLDYLGVLHRAHQQWTAAESALRACADAAPDIVPSGGLILKGAPQDAGVLTRIFDIRASLERAGGSSALAADSLITAALNALREYEDVLHDLGRAESAARAAQHQS